MNYFSVFWIFILLNIFEEKEPKKSKPKSLPRTPSHSTNFLKYFSVQLFIIELKALWREEKKTSLINFITSNSITRFTFIQLWLRLKHFHFETSFRIKLLDSGCESQWLLNFPGKFDRRRFFFSRFDSLKRIFFFLEREIRYLGRLIKDKTLRIYSGGGLTKLKVSKPWEKISYPFLEKFNFFFWKS